MIGCFVFSVACSSAPSETGFGLAEASFEQTGVVPVKVGALAPDFELQDQNGRLFRLSEFEGNYVFLNFWATWCPPCIEELPAMDALNNRWQTKPFTMIAVSVDNSWDEINSFLGRLNRSPSFLILHDPGKYVATEFFNIEKYPETFLIGPDRKVLKHYAGSFNWFSEKKIKDLEHIFGWTQALQSR